MPRIPQPPDVALARKRAQQRAYYRRKAGLPISESDKALMKAPLPLSQTKAAMAKRSLARRRRQGKA